MSEAAPASTIPPPPSRLPPPTGNLFHDSIQSAKNVAEIPCARNSLLGGIAGGVGIGVVRGLSAGALVGGNWAMATFTIVSIGTFHFCQKRFADERKKVETVIHSLPPRFIIEEENQDREIATSSNP